MAAAATEPLHIQLLHCSLVALHCSSSHCTTACSSFLTAASSLQLSRTAASPLRCSYSHRRGADVRPSRSKTSKFPFWDGPTFRIGIAATCIEAVAFSGARSQKKGCCSKSQVPPTSTSPHFPVRAPSSSPSLSLSFALSTTLPAKPFSCSHIFSFSIFLRAGAACTCRPCTWARALPPRTRYAVAVLEPPGTRCLVRAGA